MHKKVKGYIVFAQFGKKVNTNGIKKCLHNPRGYGIFFPLTTDYIWFMGLEDILLSM